MIQALVIGLLTLCAALIFLSATPPGAAPDELSHFIRVGGLASGSVFGTIPDAASFPKQAPIRAQNERIRREAGTYVLSPRFNYIVAVGGACNSFKPQQPACNSPTSPAFNPDSRQFTSLHARTQPLA
ncbi:MAG: putative rane protein, partial [Ilumatobacteraceae bacterium]